MEAKGSAGVLKLRFKVGLWLLSYVLMEGLCGMLVSSAAAVIAVETWTARTEAQGSAAVLKLRVKVGPAWFCADVYMEGDADVFGSGGHCC